MKTADWIIKFRWPIIIGFVLLTAIIGAQIPKAEMQADISEDLPENMFSKINNNKIIHNLLNIKMSDVDN